ncbi:MarR family winged helix-turn-helix transcriptional regulator [Paenibacillus sp. 2TAB19]|jgi:DNA-binding MarR family transcriptional regulator|uniref:MarR family winged helix-turn-helix transcriptional regulator n=1 Tax=Paenibacillus sp. 2TAB19 TaxID=3233003 RepID=UPI003F9A4870
MSNYEEWLSLSPLLKSTYKKLKAEWYKGVDDSFSISQIRMMQHLSRTSPIKSTDLAEMLCVTAGAVTLMGDKLYERGLIDRYRGEQDRRVVYIAITEQGKQYISSFRANDEQLIKIIAERITEKDMHELKRIILLLNESLEGDYQ